MCRSKDNGGQPTQRSYSGVVKRHDCTLAKKNLIKMLSPAVWLSQQNKKGLAASRRHCLYVSAKYFSISYLSKVEQFVHKGLL